MSDLNFISAEELSRLLTGDEEHALVDVREIDPFSRDHLFFAVPIPYGRLELLVSDLLPRQAVPIVVYDNGEGLAHRAAERLKELGYCDIAILYGGVESWKTAGYETYSGVNVPSKAFGEFVEHSEGTPSLSADDVHKMIEDGEDMIILDSRPIEEFNWASIPTGVCCAGAELVYRGFTAAPSTNTKVIVNCAGRTRSIIGAQSLINAGMSNPVYALRNGVMGWRLSGRQPASGETSWAPAPDAAGLEKAIRAGASVAKRFGVQTITQPELDEWRAQRQDRTLYVLDVRTAEEYQAGHLADAVHAPGGQLVQATDKYVGARNARIVLVDNDRARANMTASWLVQMGQPHVRVLDADLEDLELVEGPRRMSVPGHAEDGIRFIDAGDLQQKLRDGAELIDFSLSARYRRAGHIDGAWFALRSQLSESLSAIPEAAEYVLTSEDGAVATLAAKEFAAFSDASIYVLRGGNAGWVAAGHRLTKQNEKWSVAPIDVWRNPFDADKEKGETVEDAMRAYLDWEVDLIAQLERDDTTRFRRFPKDP